MKKKCPLCGNKKALDKFSVKSNSKDGRQVYCKLCAWKKRADYGLKNRDKLNLYQREWLQNNPDKKQSKESRRAYYYTNHKSVRAQQNKWARENRTDTTRQRERNKRTNNLIVNLRNRIAPRLARTVRGEKAGRKTKDLLGYDHLQLKCHIEKLFTRGMSWDRLLRGEIVIDHIIPLCAFAIKSIDDPIVKIAWGLNNLQPMWRKANLLKGSSMPDKLPDWFLNLTSATK